MARALSSTMLSHITDSTLRPVLFFEAEFASGFIRLWTGIGTKSWDGKSWTGAGSLIAVSPITEQTDLRAQGVTVTLNGLDPNIVTAVLAEARLGKAGTIYFGLVDDSDNIYSDPYVAFRGYLDIPTVEDNGASASVSISYEHELIDLERPRVGRWNNEDQQARHPGSLGFEYVGTLADKVFQF